MPYIDFIQKLHKATARDYLDRVTADDKAHCAEAALRWGEEYWDGDRRYGYGGYRYDGRWRSVAEEMARHYKLRDDAAILDVGCGKGFLLYEFTQVLPRAKVAGIDISAYAVEHSKEEVRPRLAVGHASQLPFEDRAFDLVISINTLHNLYNYELWPALQEIKRVGCGASYVTVEAYRTEREKANLMYWQLTCRAFHTPKEWEWLFQQTGYAGDYSFIFFE
jgi:ubiquinone/menaquinone biosynthesis C-methylase UbiE